MNLQNAETYLYLLSERDKPGELKCKLSPPIALYTSLPLEIGVTELETSEKCLLLSSHDIESKLSISSNLKKKKLIFLSNVDMTLM